MAVVVISINENRIATAKTNCQINKIISVKIGAGKPERRKIALVATAHYLLRCMFGMLRTGEVWRQVA